ncbi:LytTR family DNA-binding domain-containing protein [Spirosoma daeguense]
MKAVIIEDETLVARELQVKIADVADDVDVVTVLPSLKTARHWFMENAEPDLLFMDVQLGDGISFDLFNYYKLTCPVIFTTAYDEYAIRAFKANGIDYLLKPVDEIELKGAIDKCRALLDKPVALPADLTSLVRALSTGLPTNSAYKEIFIVSVRHQWVPIKTKDIACFAKENVLMLYTFTGERHILDYNSLEEIEELLNPSQFYRANRQHIVNTDAIGRVRLHENQKLTLLLKAPLKLEVDISREKAPVFKKWFDR